MYKHLIMASVAVSLLLAAAIVSTLPLQSVSAKITESCTNRGGHESEGSCNGNTDKNGKECSAKNPAGKEPGGHNPC
ncbi:MAG TPA: hypothetical protein VE130_04745 [Nitrososphaeraceae archaeon]|nr:hypothetical protein [Nitrososphaeraceae archaeon]